MKVSIITTIYKAEKDLPRLLDSMMALKSPELEFFLIDNGSPDRCGEICAEYAEKDSRFFIRSLKDNIGYIRARMLGIHECHGDYVGFSDSDDYLEPSGYDRAIEILKQHDYDMFIGAYNVHTGNKVIQNLPPFLPGVYVDEEIKNDISPQAFGCLRSRSRLHGFMWKHIYRLSILRHSNIALEEAIQPWEDQLFNIDVINNCNHIYVDNLILYNYFANSNSITAELYKHFDGVDFWRKTRLLYLEKVKRTSTGLEKRANANASLTNIYSLAINLCKNSSLKTREVVNRLKSLINNDNVLEDIIAETCDMDLDKRCLFVKYCLKFGLYQLLVNVIRLLKSFKCL